MVQSFIINIWSIFLFHKVSWLSPLFYSPPQHLVCLQSVIILALTSLFHMMSINFKAIINKILAGATSINVHARRTSWQLAYPFLLHLVIGPWPYTFVLPVHLDILGRRIFSCSFWHSFLPFNFIQKKKSHKSKRSGFFFVVWPSDNMERSMGAALWTNLTSD